MGLRHPTAALLAAGAAAVALMAGGAHAQDAPDCSGVEITVGAMTPPFIGGPAIAHAGTWEQRTGGRANVATFPFGELYTKFMTPMATGQQAFDVILHAPAWHGDFAPFLSEVPDQYLETAGWEDIHPTYRDRLMMWDGKQISVTVDGDVHTGYYRTDLFEDPEEQAAFRE